MKGLIGSCRTNLHPLMARERSRFHSRNSALVEFCRRERARFVRNLLHHACCAAPHPLASLATSPRRRGEVSAALPRLSQGWMVVCWLTAICQRPLRFTHRRVAR
jgi:hypothetical protein